MIEVLEETKYELKGTNEFKKQLMKAIKQGKDLNKIKEVVLKLANGKKLEEKYRDHSLENDKYYKNCHECHIEPDWLLVYQYNNNELILLLVNTGSHSNIFK